MIFMINCTSGVAFRVLFCAFWSTVLQCGARLPIHTFILLGRVVSDAYLETRGMYTLSGRIGKVVASHAEGHRVDSGLKLHQFILCTRRSGVLPIRVGAATSQLDLPSLTPLSVAGCGRLPQGVPHWTTSVYYSKKMIIDQI